MITKKRAEMLTRALISDQKCAGEILTTESDKILAQINTNGYDFTLDEICEYIEALKAVAALGDELDLSALDGVAGGINPELLEIVAGSVKLIRYNFGGNTVM